MTTPNCSVFAIREVPEIHQFVICLERAAAHSLLWRLSGGKSALDPDYLICCQEEGGAVNSGQIPPGLSSTNSGSELE
ncbi:hypothetical protein Ddc_09206 [Ditylenchus destructor]|nr:hypothetical protein Ddc_09206 [Ditylenchus destructor]